MKLLISRYKAAVALALSVSVLSACGEDVVGPGTPAVSLSASSLDFGMLDTNFGAGQEQTVTITNSGMTAVTVGPVTLTGGAAGDYLLIDGTTATVLNAGQTFDVTIAFDPAAAGSRSASLVVPTDGSTDSDVAVALNGMAASYAYTQVDRMGIPALNTVFNHPPAFSKTDYNVASPMADVASYTGLFETVLGAVANADPEGTAALLLPDALPVSLGANPSVFANLTGRDLADDAVDVALTVVVGPDALHSDNVDANDNAFLTTFPYLATPNN